MQGSCGRNMCECWGQEALEGAGGGRRREGGQILKALEVPTGRGFSWGPDTELLWGWQTRAVLTSRGCCVEMEKQESTGQAPLGPGAEVVERVEGQVHPGGGNVVMVPVVWMGGVRQGLPVTPGTQRILESHRRGRGYGWDRWGDGSPEALWGRSELEITYRQVRFGAGLEDGVWELLACGQLSMSQSQRGSPGEHADGLQTWVGGKMQQDGRGHRGGGGGRKLRGRCPGRGSILTAHPGVAAGTWVHKHTRVSSGTRPGHLGL